VQEKFEDINGLNRNSKSKKDIQRMNEHRAVYGNIALSAVDCRFEHRSDTNIALSAVDCRFEHRSDKNKDNRIDTFCICYFSVDMLPFL
jgi:hypothetical protein